MLRAVVVVLSLLSMTTLAAAQACPVGYYRCGGGCCR